MHSSLKLKFVSLLSVVIAICFSLKFESIILFSHQQEAVVGELKQKQRMIKEKKVLNRDEVYHGALEDILLGLSIWHY